VRVYVELTYTIAVDVDHGNYDTTTDDELLEACRNDPDFALERLHNGPHAVYEMDWRVPDLWGHNRRAFDAMPDTADGYEVLTRWPVQP